MVASIARINPNPQPALLRRLPDGTIQALSSDGHTVYTLSHTLSGAYACTCRGYQSYTHCRHADAAARRFPQPAAVECDCGVLVYGRRYCATCREHLV